jgi:hypothetical protein
MKISMTLIALLSYNLMIVALVHLKTHHRRHPNPVTVTVTSVQVSVDAEYILKQSKIHMGSADVNQLKDQYRFGYGISMG